MSSNSTRQPPDPPTNDAEEAARQAAEAAGLPLDAWLRQTIKETVAAELTTPAGEAPATHAEDSAPAAASEQAAARSTEKDDELEEEEARRAAENAAAAAGIPIGAWLGELLRAASREELAAQPSSGETPTPPEQRIPVEPEAGAPQADISGEPEAALASEADATPAPDVEPESHIDQPDAASAAAALPPEVERIATAAAASAGVPVATWLTQLVEEASRGSGAPADIAAREAPLELPLKRVSPDRLIPGRFQMRAQISAEELAALAESIKARGVLQPILVRALEDDAYEIVAGERRWRASRAAGLTEIPVLVLAVPDREAMEIALVENLQRHDLSSLEEAEGYRRLTEELGETQEKIAEAIGKSRSHVANTLRLLRLPEPVKAMLAEGRLGAGHGRAILTAADPEALARRAVMEGLTVRELEQLAQAEPGLETPSGRRRAEKDPDLEQIEEELSRLFGVAVRIALRGAGDRGTLTIRFKGLERLHEIIERLRT